MQRDRPSLHIDFETFSVINLLTRGETVYAEKAVPLLTGLKYENEKTQVFDHHEAFNEGTDDFGDFDLDYAPECPDLIREGVKDNWYFIAHNWSFENAILLRSLKRMGWAVPRIDQWICTAAKARYWGLSGTLEKAGQMLNLPIQKDKEGSRLIKKFCIPQKTGRGKNASTFIRTIDPTDPDWLWFKRYNRDDVETEWGIDTNLPDIPDKFMRFFHSDARMNTRGFPVDIEGVKAAVTYYDFFNKKLENRFKKLSGGLLPTQVAKVKEIINASIETGLADTLDNLQSATIRDALLDDDANGLLAPEAREMLEIRAETAKASVKKLSAFLLRTASDGRAYGGFLFYGAHTGRRSGKGIQPQNFPRGIKAALKQLRAFFRWIELISKIPGALEIAEIIYNKPLEVLAAALRGFIKARKGKKFVVVDYSQIELRVGAWLAGEQELLEQLKLGLDPYIQFAANYMYDVEPSEISKEDIRRQIAKSALLGAQYQIWITAFMAYAKATAGLKLTLEEASHAVVSYRNANPAIVDFWKLIEKACISAVDTRETAYLNNLRIRVEVHSGREWLRIYLPSGRPISYFEPKVSERITEHEKTDRDGNPIFNSDGTPATYTKRKKVLSFLTEWNSRITREYTYGGKLFENAVQGTSADIMYEGEIIAEENGYPLVMSVHDETVTEVDEDFGSVAELARLVCQLPDCYEGLPIAAEGHECVRYSKG